MDRVEQMPVYQLFFQLALDVEKATRSFGPEFRWLRVQCLRSSEGAGTAVVEGFYSQYSTEYLQALYRCRREARETMGHIRYGLAVHQIKEADASGILARYEEAAKQLANLITSIERKIEQHGKSKVNASRLSEAEESYEIDAQGPSTINHQPSTINHRSSDVPSAA
jgi:four helix bundle protein